MIGGSGARDYIERAKHRLKELRVIDRFLLFDKEIALAQYAELLQAADVYLSLMATRDMRSSSILQGAATGACPILNRDPEYQEMEKLGFRALYVDPKDAGQIVTALKRYRFDAQLRETVVKRNQEYIDTHEDFDHQMNMLLEMIEEVCRLKRTPSVSH